MELHVEEKTEDYWSQKDYRSQLFKLIQVIVGLPKSVYFNLHYFGRSGWKLPVILSPKVKLSKLKGKVFIESDFRLGMIKLGFPATEAFDNRKLSFIWVNDGVVVFKNSASMHNGTSIRNYGLLEIGNNFHIPATATIICYKRISFGDDVLVGWNFEATDGDAHKIYKKEDLSIRTNPNKEIIVGNKVWFGADVRLYKGIAIANNTVVAAGTRIYKNDVNCENCIIGGNPIQVIKKDVSWEI